MFRNMSSGLSILALLLGLIQISVCFAPSTPPTAQTGSRNTCTTAARPKRASRRVLNPQTHLCATATEPETFEFQAEVSRVMDIIINSLYSNKDVFLRELVSNAADACDKKRFLSIADGSTAFSELGIRVSADRASRTLTIEDRGVGMTKDELVNNLGRIAQSGTRKFVEALGSGKADVSLIGQFGVGFYSGFLVADKITVVTKSMQPNSPQLRWESSAGSSFTVTPDNSTPFEESGTRVILHVKEEMEEYLDDANLSLLLQKYSEFIQFPIELQRNVSKVLSEPDIDAPVEEDGTIPTKAVTKRVLEWTTINEQKPVWLREPESVTQQEYAEFYKQVFRQYEEPAAHSHFKVEGQVEFRALLYVPGEVPFEMMRDMFPDANRPIRLYVKRVFINDNFKELVPRWLSFLRGVVDSEDLPLNVGREILQKSRMLSVIQKRIVRKSIDMIRGLEADTNTTAYDRFWKNFGKYVKVGVIEEEDSRKDLLPLLRLPSTYKGGELTSLKDYVSRMKEDQKFIYYVTGENRAVAEMSPILEAIREKGYEVLYACDPLDELTLQAAEKFQDKQLSDVAKDRLEDLSDEEKRKKDIGNTEYETLRDWLKKLLGDKITGVNTSARLKSSPAALVQSEYGMSPTMQRYMKAQMTSQGDESLGMSTMFSQAILEINNEHEIVRKLKSLVDADSKSEAAKDLGFLLYDVAALTGGYSLANPGEFARRVVDVMSRDAVM